MKSRRSIRHFKKDEDISLDILQSCVKAAGTAPSGANKQPWHFVIVKNKKLKSLIRKYAEREEFRFYHNKNLQTHQ